MTPGLKNTVLEHRSAEIKAVQNIDREELDGTTVLAGVQGISPVTHYPP